MLPSASLRPKHRPATWLSLRAPFHAPLHALLAATLLGGCCGMGSENQDNPAPAASTTAQPLPSSTVVSDALPSGPAGANPAAQPTTEVIPPAVQAPTERQIAGAAHILIAYKGAERAPKTITRSKEEAKKRAQEALNKLKTDKATFEDIVKQYSDDDVSKPANGAVGNFERNAMPAPFADATFGMEVGALSDIVETPQGFHIIKRTK